MSILLPAQSNAQLLFDSTLTPRTLPNGFRYYLKKNPEDNPKQVDLRLVIKAGAFQEDEDQLGIAHFVEHMAFNGTQNFSQADLFRAFKRLKIDFGPDANATTNFDYTEYRLKSATDSLVHLKLSLDILYDWASGLKFAATEVEAEKGVLLAEKRERNSPPAQFQQALFKWLYSSSCPKENLEDLLALLHLRLSRPQLEQVALEQVIGMEKRRLAEEAENPYVFFEQLHQRKEHPQEAKLWAPSPDDLDKITLATLRQVYEDRFFNTKDFSFVIVGEVDTQTVFPLLQRYLGSLPACGKPEEYLNRMDDPFPLQALDTSIYMLNTPKAVVEISYFGLREHPKKGGYYNLYLQEWQKILEKALFQELREKRGAIYHVDVRDQFIQAFQDFGFKIWFECEPSRVAELIAATDSIIAATVSKKILKEAFAALEAKFSRPSNAAPPRLDLNYWRFLLDNDATMLEAMINAVEAKPIPVPTEKKRQTHPFRKPGAFYPALQKLVTPEQRWQVVLLPKR